ncbi:DUF3237 domain-containing protein [Pseudonocardia ailaonensis]|uniref:UPF0311 protein GCM10009836_09930 n=1 Tax=Pseudonocardia ailaonensis TaxID=367279 RepID=A0ABN2MQ43_9PSEU
MPKLALEFEMHADLALHDAGAGPFGQRMLFTVTGGDVAGDRVKGRLVGASGDWLLAGPDGMGRLDVRATLETSDGAIVLIQYHGVLELSPGVMAAVGGEGPATEYGAQYFFTAPRAETGDERYAWMNRTVFLGQGRVLPGPAVEYRVFRVDND